VASRRDIDRLRGELDELFSEFWRSPRLSGPRQCFRPPVDCYRTERPPQFVVKVELSGVDPGAVHLLVDDGTLYVAGERRRPAHRAEGPIYQQMEIQYGPFQRRVVLPDDADSERATARYQRGFLTVVFPIRELARRSARVPITVRTRR
jgi:HSP20 family protein